MADSRATWPPDAKRLDRELETLDASARIRRTVADYGQDVILTTSFGPTAGVMLKLVSEVLPDMRVVTIVHGHETERTRELMDLYTRRFKLKLKVYEAPRLRGGILAVYPMLDWTPLQAIDYCIAQKLPMNEDYYNPSKGPRQDQECGIHTHSLEA